MASWPENFVDTIVTDPPYGLSFMGKDWDHGIPGEHFWSEMLRICKPGATLLAFGGTRTYHRLAVAIEDAGWEIRDCLMWLYGSGFPKSLDISKAIQKEFECRYLKNANHVERSYQRFPVELNGARTDFAVVNAVIRQEAEQRNGMGIGVEVGFKDQTDTLLFESTEPTDSNTILSWKKELEDLSKNTSKSITLIKLETITGLKIWNLPQSPTTLRNILNFDGHGTALKPAWEPIIVAMKPIDGTFAENAEKWGVAGINVDGSRIGIDGGTRKLNPEKRQSVTAYGDGLNGGGCEDIGKGRWPANLILDEEAAAMLDGKSGGTVSRPSDYNFEQGNNDHPTRFNNAIKSGIHHSDSGGASRFFYVAKSAKAERNEGCGLLPRRSRQQDGNPENWDLSDGTVREKFTTQPQGNHHPTVKPLDLMKYLCNLTKTPTGGIVLDPFAGSGTTLWAAECHNRPWIGIEMNPEYVAIAEARIARERAQIKLQI
jgi:DNA modification methylase